MKTNQLWKLTICGRRVLALILLTVAGLVQTAQAQGSLPDLPAGFTWESQGVMVYTCSGAFTLDIGSNDTAAGSLSQVEIDQTISLTTYDASPSLGQHGMLLR